MLSRCVSMAMRFSFNMLDSLYDSRFSPRPNLALLDHQRQSAAATG